jgi:hypothetical protein
MQHSQAMPLKKKMYQFLVLPGKVIDLLSEIPNYGAEFQGDTMHYTTSSQSYLLLATPA